MSNKTVLFAVASLIIPFASAAAVSILDGTRAPAIGSMQAAAPLLALDATGLGLSVLALARSNPKPVNTSLSIRTTAFCAAVGIFLNVVVIEVIVAACVSR